jgi:hypothetical protein
MNVKDWIETMSRLGLVCSDYMRKISAADSREDIFRVLCDANGGNWLFEQHAKGLPLPIDDFCKEFFNYLNGKRVMEYQQGYTSKFYCRSLDDIDADTTLVYILECMDTEVYVPKNKYPSVILSDGSQCDLVIGEGARANVDLYGDASVNVIGDMSRVRITKH